MKGRDVWDLHPELRVYDRAKFLDYFAKYKYQHKSKLEKVAQSEEFLKQFKAWKTRLMWKVFQSSLNKSVSSHPYIYLILSYPFRLHLLLFLRHLKLSNLTFPLVSSFLSFLSREPVDRGDSINSDFESGSGSVDEATVGTGYLPPGFSGDTDGQAALSTECLDGRHGTGNSVGCTHTWGLAEYGS